jgi:beta-galactosidase
LNLSPLKEENAVPARVTRIENRSWLFAYGDHPPTDAGNADATWYDIGLPHSFAVPADLETTFYMGVGCYRHDLDIRPEWVGRVVRLEFGAVFQHAEVFVNGQLVTTHDGGYSAFEADISRFVHAGTNALFVRVDNEWDPVLPPRAGEHVFNGGIYRDVTLTVTDPVHVARNGLRITTPDVSSTDASVRVGTRLRNESDESAELTIDCAILLDGEPVARSTTALSIAARTTETSDLGFEIESPSLWHPDHPVLYTAVLSVSRNGIIIDEVEDTFGIRWFEFTSDRGFFLNGQHLWLEGVNVHQDHAGWGDGITHSAIARDVALIKEAGMNFIRGSHYPHHQQFARECDRQGILFWSEAPFWGTGGETVEGFWTASAYPVFTEHEERFERNALQALEDMINENVNRASVIAWSTGNEVYFGDPSVLDKAKALTVRMVDRIHEVDPTRPAAVGGAQRGGLDVLGDVAGYNGDGAALYPDPGFPSMVTEYGSFVEDRPGESGARYTDGTETPHPWRSGVALWCGFHHGSIFAGMSRMGFIDHHRLPLRSWHWYREKLTGVPAPSPAGHGTPKALTIESDVDTVGTDGLSDARLLLTVLDESGQRTDVPIEVELKVIEGDGRLPTGRSTTLSYDDGSLLDGMASVDLRSYFAGQILVRATAPGIEPAEVTITSTGEESWDGRELSFSPGPPSRMTIPRPAESANIARNRPVFASGTGRHRTPSWITEPNTAAGWVAPDESPGHWVVVDLEGPRRLSKIAVIAVGDHPLRVQTSAVHRDEGYELVGEGSPDAYARLDWEFPTRDVRFIRVEFPGAPDELHIVEAYQEANS